MEETYIPTEQEFEQESKYMPHPVVIQAGDMIVLSKTNAQEFHEKMREMILETGYGMFEYLEVLKFFENVNKQVKGDSQARIPEDKEFINAVRDELSKYEKGKHTTARGVRFELAETGTNYDFSVCQDPILDLLEIELEEKKQAVAERKEFLKTIRKEGESILDQRTGEVNTVFPPKKNSKSSYKITLAK
jgi:flagellar motility protein MotE (MotC chaperone)